MSNHVYSCSEQDHVIFDISEEPVPHIGTVERIYCPTCEKDVDGEYIGQAINYETRAIGDTRPEKDIQLYKENGCVYCLHCDGLCEK